MVIFLGLDIIFLAAVLYVLWISKKFTPVAKSLLPIPLSFLAGDLLAFLGYQDGIIEIGYTMAWVFSTILLAYTYTVEKGKPRKEILNLGGAVLFSPVLMFIGNNAGYPLVLCYGIGILVFSNFLVEETKDIRTSGALGLLACSILLAIGLAQILGLQGIDENIPLVPRAILLTSLVIFGYSALAPGRVRVSEKEKQDSRNAFQTVLRLKEERRAIHSQIGAMLTELRRIKKDKSSGKIDGVYESLRKEYTKEVAMLRKSSSKKLKEMKEIEKKLEMAVAGDKKELAKLKKRLDEEARALQKVKEALSKETKKT